MSFRRTQRYLHDGVHAQAVSVVAHVQVIRIPGQGRATKEVMDELVVGVCPPFRLRHERRVGERTYGLTGGPSVSPL